MELTQEHSDQITASVTESTDPRYQELDLMSTEGILQAMNQADRLVPEAISQVISQIARAVEAAAAGMAQGGRLLYVGAGTSGRLGVLDASEIPPTFSVDPARVVGIIAGGDHALRHAIEGAEDDYAAGRADLLGYRLSENDTVVGITASGRTPYVLGAIAAAQEAGATTVGISNNSPSDLGTLADIPIEVVVGPEIVSGSTRLKAGTAQKLVLNMISTGTMIRLGKTYGNLMVDVSATNKKLQVRAQNLVMRITGCELEQAKAALAEADGNVKVASVSLLRSLSAAEAKDLLAGSGGFLRAALDA
ncbi:N-acetylmuramic acid 6-phosphate etherase [Scrofimicrobium sp. R131]|uniref:N-acetylmuramic acid 6-phosphate etherase n=1 Tax=Scrofimicrobium appendicitidis TaxID=3079930 RepID=A0AAU7V6E6_9ACTO